MEGGGEKGEIERAGRRETERPCESKVARERGEEREKERESARAREREMERGREGMRGKGRKRGADRSAAAIKAAHGWQHAEPIEGLQGPRVVGDVRVEEAEGAARHAKVPRQGVELLRAHHAQRHANVDEVACARTHSCR